MLLEGEDLPALMARVKAEMGPGARIIKAEKVRTGGVAGFFARERYELTVEVPEPETARRPAGRGRAGAGSRSGASGAAGAGTGGAVGAVGIEALLAAAEAAESDDGGAGGARSSADAGTAEPPVVSTSSPSFAEILESMRQMVGPAGASAAEGSAPPPAVPAEAPASDLAGADTSAQAGPDVGAGEASSAEVVEDVPADAVETDAVVEAPPRPGNGSSVSALLELGVPTRLLQGFSSPDTPLPLSVLVRRFDRPPTLRALPGGVIAVVGAPDLALRTSMQMAARAGVEPQDIVLAGAMPPVAGHGRRLQTPSAVARARARIAEDVPTIVAVGVGEERSDWTLAADILDALTAHQAWAAVDARRKLVDVRRWMRAVGAHRPFDALAACNTFDAQAPGAVLGLGTPVGWVDGLPATPVVWAAVLSERLADDARWD
ncbi:hypothetical protein GCM10010972_13200 [Cellulomonas carbonis]|nr:hypothetical protein GCM10010972_13200 [Cellulomonas carbonis]